MLPCGIISLSAAGEWLVGKVDKAAWTYYKRVKRVSIGMKTVVSNPSNKEIHKRLETNKSNKLCSNGRNMSEEEKASKSQEGRKFDQNSLISYDKTKSREYVLDRPPKKPGGEEVDNINTATTITCDTSQIARIVAK